jgi:uroporphyrinogen decarboxylase
MRQAGRYMAEYREVRKHHSLIDICKNPQLSAEVTITAAEILGVDAAIIFSDLLLPLGVMGLDFRFENDEGPVVDKPLRQAAEVAALRTDRTADLGYVAEAVQLVAKHFADRVPVIGFCGAPFTLASYMIEGGGSRHYLETKKMMFRAPETWDQLMSKLVEVLAEHAAGQVRAGADAVQIFDSWVGCLSVEDYVMHVLPRTKELVQKIRKTGVPVIYFGTDTATLLPFMKQTGAEVMGVDWRIPLDLAWSALGDQGSVQGNLDPVLLFADWKLLRARAEDVLRRAAGHPGHIFNLGHGILPNTPVENVKALTGFIHEASAASEPERIDWFGER